MVTMEITPKPFFIPWTWRRAKEIRKDAWREQ